MADRRIAHPTIAHRVGRPLQEQRVAPQRHLPGEATDVHADPVVGGYSTLFGNARGVDVLLQMNMEIVTTAAPHALHPEMIRIEGGVISLKNEATGRYWTINVRSFQLAKFPVTQSLYRSIMHGIACSDISNLPVVDVSWNDAVLFCNLLSRHTGLSECYSRDVSGEFECDWESDGYRLPSEAEWEYACRAGSNDARYGELDAVAWYRDNSANAVHEIGLKQPNAWALHDMLGNVWEWCWDHYDKDVYGPYRVFRGGGWSDPPTACRASCRRKSHPTYRIDDLGFRIARSVVRPGE
jgi:formylglycine-generating enzyme required for sulfatase activity